MHKIYMHAEPSILAYMHIPMLGHTGRVGGKLASDWDVSGCGVSGRLIREMKLDWEEGWEERTRKDKTVRGSERQEKGKRSGKATSPWARRMSRQTVEELGCRCKSVLQVKSERKCFIPKARQRLFRETKRRQGGGGWKKAKVFSMPKTNWVTSCVI